MKPRALALKRHCDQRCEAHAASNDWHSAPRQQEVTDTEGSFTTCRRCGERFGLVLRDQGANGTTRERRHDENDGERHQPGDQPAGRPQAEEVRRKPCRAIGRNA